MGSGSPAAERAIRNLQQIIREAYGDEAPCDLEVIDILATPVVIKKLPPPVRRVVGELSERDKVLIGLDLREPGE